MSKRFRISIAAFIVVVLAIVSAQMVFAVEDDPGPWYPLGPTKVYNQAGCLANGGTDVNRRSLGYSWCIKTCEDGTVYAADIKWADGKGKLILPFYYYFY